MPGLGVIVSRFFRAPTGLYQQFNYSPRTLLPEGCWGADDDAGFRSSNVGVSLRIRVTAKNIRSRKFEKKTRDRWSKQGREPETLNPAGKVQVQLFRRLLLLLLLTLDPSTDSLLRPHDPRPRPRALPAKQLPGGDGI